MDIYYRALFYGICSVITGLSAFYTYFKYTKMSSDEADRLPQSSEERKIKYRIDKYGWLCFLLGLILLILGVYELTLAFD